MRKTALVYSAFGTVGLLVVWTVPAGAQQFDWTGPYVGASVGVVLPDGSVPLNYPDGVTATDTVYFSDNVPLFSGSGLPIDPIAWPGEADLAGANLLGTVNLGYNLQQGAAVYGIELDASVLDSGATWTTGDVYDGTNFRTHGLTVSGGLDQLLSLRARLGVGLDRLLLFGTAGLAAGHANLDTSAYLDQGYGTADWEGHASDWRLGFIVGAGAEYAVTDQLSVKLEGLYYDLGSMTAEAGGTGSFGITPLEVAPYDATLSLSGVILRGGVNLRF